MIHTTAAKLGLVAGLVLLAGCRVGTLDGGERSSEPKLTIRMSGEGFRPTEAVCAVLTLSNTTEHRIRVFDLFFLGGHVLAFRIQHEDDGQLPLIGGHVRERFREDDIVSLSPGEHLNRTVCLCAESGAEEPGPIAEFDFSRRGTYEIVAVYTGIELAGMDTWVGQVESPPVRFRVE